MSKVQLKVYGSIPTLRGNWEEEEIKTAKNNGFVNHLALHHFEQVYPQHRLQYLQLASLTLAPIFFKV